jgi:hypothetical protein
MGFFCTMILRDAISPALHADVQGTTLPTRLARLHARE